MVDIIVDGKTLSVDEKGNLITELKKYGIEIPHFCYHEALGVSGNCRMCLIEVVGQKRPQIACDMPITAGMEIKINSDLTRKVQRGLLELEFINHSLDCPVCDQAGECALQEYYMKFDKQDSKVKLVDKVQKAKKQDFGCLVIHDSERCVLCRRCVKFTQICTKTYELGIAGRGEHSHISLFDDRKIDNPYAGNIVDICPVGAMTSGDFRFKKRVWHLKISEAICQGCEKGCAIYIDSHKEKYEDHKIYRFRPRFDKEVNGHFICDYGRYLYKDEQPFFKDTNEKALLNLKSFAEQNRAKFDVVVTSALSLEEMYAAREFANEFGANIYGYDDFFDESFDDKGNMLNLRSPNKTPNKKGLEYFGISTNLEALKDNVIVFNLGIPIKLNIQNIITVSQKADADVLCASAYHRNGHTINKDGILRSTKAAFLPLAPCIEEIIAKICDKSFKFDIKRLLNE